MSTVRSLDPARWQAVKRIVGEALERNAGAEREKYLAETCGADADLRAEVASLLDQTTGRLEECAEGARRPPTWGIAEPGRRLGPWRLLRELGRGGMGAVWLAERADGRWQQQVAIKLLKRGVDTDEVLRRFEAERQILARLEHPNIARLLDGGETDEGLPYLVMEHVAGTTITNYAHRHGCGVEQCLALFRKVCTAVEFAHRNLVIHRDLKPGNILVTDAGEPKLLDFGIAKLVDPEAGLDVTAAEDRPFTAAYASPEQVRGEVVTTSSDVYSLGALLYELLCGHSPHRFRGTHPTASEVARVIGEVSPPRPSLTASDPARRRRLRGDLDTIVLRALAKDPARRYPSVLALAEDLERHATGRPVRARADTWTYRAGKFVRRNRVLAGVATALVLALLGGAAATLWQARRAERRFQDVRRLANAFLFEFHDAIATLPGSTPARRLVVSRGLEYLDDLAREAGDDEELHLELARAYLRLGDVQGRPYAPNLGDAPGALRSYLKAQELVAPETGVGGTADASLRLWCQAGVSIGDLLIRLGRAPAALESYRRALEAASKALAKSGPGETSWRALATDSLMGLGDAVQAQNHQRKSLAAYREAYANYLAAQQHAERLAVGAAPGSPEMLRLARVEARAAAMLGEIARATSDRAAFRQSLELHARKLAHMEAAVEAAPENARLRRNLADGLVARAYARELAREELAEALEDCRRALAILEPLAAADASNVEAQQDLAYAHYNHGRVHQALGQAAEAAAQYRRALAILDPLVAANPANGETAFDQQRARQGLAEVGQPAP